MPQEEVRDDSIGTESNTDGNATAFRAAPASLAAQNFNMPALSPTMTEGNIATWKVKEGDSFIAGDVLLEIETDKASMDVEAQDDGIMAKIMQGDGSKGVQVGTRIAVTAEPGDDISSVDIPAEDNPAPQKSDAKEEPKQESAPVAKEERTSAPESKPAPSSDASKKASGGKAQKQTYPLYPSVHQLMKENGLPKEEADKIPATGPNGRLLKGDVLAYLGRIEGSYVSKQFDRIHKLAHLDLSNIKLAPPKPAAPEKAAAAEPLPIPEELDIEIATSVSLKAVYEVQKRVQDSIGVFLPLSTFIARATELANEDLPRSKTAKPSADELFNSVLGLDNVAGKTSQGVFTPQVTALPPTSLRASRPSSLKKPDIIDILAGKKVFARPAKAPISDAVRVVAPVNVFSVSVPKGDERRAQLFLQRIKAVLEAEPGRLVV
ncbi:hypothetical protein BDV96DRAFT_615458 [Lophiotrema nucula]|uniref:Pyruvate dehydrogenase protein x component n=1 Tax=Lophiotrema nucula TaxID=690887 RepID=A0A6A5YVN2_9PLEO|nr:hypothetical protein BDV96DRAFT_615458 [Lophiotrema nucula]